MDEETQQDLPIDHVFEVHVPAGAPWQAIKAYFHAILDLYRKDSSVNVLTVDLPGDVTPEELAAVYGHLQNLRANVRGMVRHRKAHGG